MTVSFKQGANSLAVSAELFAENRRRLCTILLQDGVIPEAVIFLQGGIDQKRYNTDADGLPFRQESYFFWTFGVHESGFSGLLSVGTGKSVLFAPKLHPDYAIWQGKIQSEQYFTDRYEVNETRFLDENTILNTLKEMKAGPIILLRAKNSDSDRIMEPPSFLGIEKFTIDIDRLYPIIAELRVFKTDYELQVMRYANKIGSEAHKSVMKIVRPKMYEYQLESTLRHYSYFHGGCRYMHYTCIAGCGSRGAILHYGHENAPNNQLINDGDLCLIDYGPEYCCYGSDITTTFPANGIFTDKQKSIYDSVLMANKAVFDTARPGIRWTEMHKLAERVILTGLKSIGIIKGDIEEMMQVRLGAIFMPHGLGHFIGLDVHDVGGYLGDALPRSTENGLKSLRTTRVLKERMVITIEPGCYFIDTLLDQAFANQDHSQFLVREKIAEFRDFGGVRIEDVVVIWKNGCENLTNLPRTVLEIETFMAS